MRIKDIVKGLPPTLGISRETVTLDRAIDIEKIKIELDLKRSSFNWREKYVEEKELSNLFTPIKDTLSISLDENNKDLFFTTYYKIWAHKTLKCFLDIYSENNVLYVQSIYYRLDEDDLPELETLKAIFKDFQKEERNIYLITKQNTEIVLKRCDLFLEGFNLDQNYNDDFKEVHEFVLDKLTNKKQGLFLFHGIPGTGKSSYIKELTALIPGKKFIFIPNFMVQEIITPSFLSFMMQQENSVLILEDCEEFIKSRDSGQNNIVPTLLNLTDGILADALNLQIICTFNTDLKNIDKALLREGRLHCQYEFKSLTVDKVKSYFDKNNIKESIEEMSLADMLNINKKAKKLTEPTRKIGF